ncbi:MAG: hypothetical protein RLZZ393_1319 [Pseudomonadota bacterium]|jgi:RecB family endonuclease NucS
MSSPETTIPDNSATGEFRILGTSERYTEWVARIERSKGRQAAVSRNLRSLTNYKRWAETVRGNWEDEPDGT